jgi:phosphatidylglycerophosphate synthase
MKGIQIDLLHRDLWISSILQIIIAVLSIRYQSTYVLVAGIFISFFYWSTKTILKNKIEFVGGIPNRITVSRLTLLLLCTLFNAQLTLFQLGIAYSVICIGDFFDGYIARKLNQTSVFGEYLDKETDAAFVLVLSIMIYFNIHQSYWVLIPGLIRYVYFTGIYFFMGGNEKEHKDPWARTIAVFLFIALIAQFILPTQVSKPILIMATAAVLYSFGRSIYYQLNSYTKN